VKTLTASECLASIVLILACGACAPTTVSGPPATVSNPPATVPKAPETPAGNAVETKVQSLDELEVELCRLQNEAYDGQFDFFEAVTVEAEHFMPLLQAYMAGTREGSKIFVKEMSTEPFEYVPPQVGLQHYA
jgi:hypothetical protein